MTAVSARFSKARIIAVEMLRGPDHRAMRTGSAMASVAAARGLRVLELCVKPAQALSEGTGKPAAQNAAVDFGHRSHAAEGAGDEGLIGLVDVVEGEVAEMDRDAVGMAERDDIGAGDAVEEVLAGRSAQLAAAGEEEVGGVATGDEAVGIEHERLVGAALYGVEQRPDQVQPAVRVEPHVEHVGRGAADAGSGELQPAHADVRARLLVLGHDDNGRMAESVARILVWCVLGPARDHQPDVDTALHTVGFDRASERGTNLLAAHADVERDGARAVEQAVEMRLFEQQGAVVQPQPFPHAIAQHEAGVEDGDLGFAARHHLAVEIDEHALVARIGGEILTAGHASGAHAMEAGKLAEFPPLRKRRPPREFGAGSSMKRAEHYSILLAYSLTGQYCGRRRAEGGPA